LLDAASKKPEGVKIELNLNSYDDLSPIRMRADGDRAIFSADDLSPIRMHADGDRAILSAVQYGELKSQLFELTLADGKVAARLVPDPARLPSCDSSKPERLLQACSARNTVTAVAYGYEGANYITGRLNGEVYCGTEKIIDPSTKLASERDTSPVSAIVSHSRSPWFASLSPAPDRVLRSE
jgi:hypothetical protein